MENINLSKNETVSAMNYNCVTDGMSYTDTNNTCNSLWGYWQGGYYPSVIRESYPVYLQERAQDKGKTAFEIIKALQDKHLMKLDKVSDFIEAMDCLIKIV